MLLFYWVTLGLKATLERPTFAILGQTNAPSPALGTHSEGKGKNADPARHMVDFDTDEHPGRPPAAQVEGR